MIYIVRTDKTPVLKKVPRNVYISAGVGRINRNGQGGDDLDQSGNYKDKKQVPEPKAHQEVSLSVSSRSAQERACSGVILARHHALFLQRAAGRIR